MEQIKKIYRNSYKEIASFAKKVETLWEKRIYNCFNIEDFEGIKLRKYLAPEGGYRIRYSQWEELDKEIRNHFEDKIKYQNEWVYFRGYRYYSLDELIHYRDIKLDNQKAIKILADRWKSYQNSIFIIRKLNNPKLKWPEYLAIISMLEWIWNDYASISWVAMQMHNEEYENTIMMKVDMLASVIVECVFWYFVSPNRNKEYEVQVAALEEIVNDELWVYIYEGINEYVRKQKGYIFRSIREGDQLWLVLANSEIKFIPWINKNCFTKVMLLNNAFGAINIGYLIKHMCKISIDVMNIYSSVHEEEMRRYDNSYTSFMKEILGCYEHLIIIDDSIFTGRSINKIKRAYASVTDSITCLVMTYDISTYFNHPEEMNFNNSPLESVLEVQNEVRKMEGLLTPARSYWAYKKKVNDIEDDEYQKKVKGSDVLIRILWGRFEEEIKNERNY